MDDLSKSSLDELYSMLCDRTQHVKQIRAEQREITAEIERREGKQKIHALVDSLSLQERSDLAQVLTAQSVASQEDFGEIG